MDPWVRDAAAEIARRAEAELEALVGVSSPSGDVAGAEEAIAIARALLPAGVTVQRPPCSSGGHADDLLATVAGTGQGRVVLLGHVDTVVGHDDHRALSADGDRLYGSGAIDMKGGVVLALGVLRALAAEPSRFAEAALLLVCDEEWRAAPFRHGERFAGYDACLCFEAGQLDLSDGVDEVIVRRKAAGTLRVTARGRAAHAGSAPDRGANALLALAEVARTVHALHDPDGPQRLTAVPTVVRAGGAFNVVPADGALTCDLRADSARSFDTVLATVPERSGEVRIEAEMVRVWPGMDARARTAPVLDAAARRVGRAIRAGSRGGASDASHMAAVVPLTIDGLGPRGSGAHAPVECVLRSSRGPRAEIALAVALSALESRPAAAPASAG
ncbi:MAG TPA: M20/M25/M40 family metallo-hydrolase [Solirubrobacteraceae bacterium]|nr:M20/M25/M40 family metallo-hydrolase [Solirubrobacteraceae bacterium]